MGALKLVRTRFEKLRDAALERTYISVGNRRTSSPHEFYRYPARFPPRFARAAIDALTSPGELVLDPFVGGGTSLVEARLAARPAVGSDLNKLATFVSQVKTRPLSARDLDDIGRWVARLVSRRDAPVSATSLKSLRAWASGGYLRNVDGNELDDVRATLAKAITALNSIESSSARRFARCAILRVGQAALDMRSEIPSGEEVFDSIGVVAQTMTEVARAYAKDVARADASYALDKVGRRTRILTQGLPGLGARLRELPAPRLVLTSPPYPGVYVNYHRWKVRGRRETPAPYWIAGCNDGNGLAYYTMSSRSDRTLNTYFERLTEAFADVATLCDESTVVVQMVGFHDPERDLARYLEAMKAAGFAELRIDELATANDGRLWRTVPNRRWWAMNSPHYETGSEVVLLHVLTGEGRLPVTKRRLEAVVRTGNRLPRLPS